MSATNLTGKNYLAKPQLGGSWVALTPSQFTVRFHVSSL